jgi:hypothetical protein
MGRDLGELGTSHVRDDTFTWFGHVVRVAPTFSDLRLLDFMEVAASIDEANALQAMGAMRGFLHSIVHEDDFPTFWRACLDNGQGVKDLMELVNVLTADAADRPTQRRSGSSPGRRKTAARSKDTSSRKVIRLMEDRGRADLAQIVNLHDDESATG